MHNSLTSLLYNFSYSFHQSMCLRATYSNRKRLSDWPDKWSTLYGCFCLMYGGDSCENISKPTRISHLLATNWFKQNISQTFFFLPFPGKLITVTVFWCLFLHWSDGKKSKARKRRERHPSLANEIVTDYMSVEYTSDGQWAEHLTRTLPQD